MKDMFEIKGIGYERIENVSPLGCTLCAAKDDGWLCTNFPPCVYTTSSGHYRSSYYVVHTPVDIPDDEPHKPTFANKGWA